MGSLLMILEYSKEIQIILFKVKGHHRIILGWAHLRKLIPILQEELNSMIF